jgi:hypothetical protein
MKQNLLITSISTLLLLSSCGRECCDLGNPDFPALFIYDQSTGIDMLDTAKGGIAEGYISVRSPISENIVAYDYEVVQWAYQDTLRNALRILPFPWSRQHQDTLPITLELWGYGIYEIAFVSESIGDEQYQFTGVLLEGEEVTESNDLCWPDNICGILRLTKKE